MSGVECCRMPRSVTSKRYIGLLIRDLYSSRRVSLFFIHTAQAQKVYSVRNVYSYIYIHKKRKVWVKDDFLFFFFFFFGSILFYFVAAVTSGERGKFSFAPNYINRTDTESMSKTLWPTAPILQHTVLSHNVNVESQQAKVYAGERKESIGESSNFLLFLFSFSCCC